MALASITDGWCRVPVAELDTALSSHTSAVLMAPPGAGKSTGVPLALLDAAWLGGRKILMLQPRRIAARAVASRMASLLGEQAGETVGYRTRMDSRVGPQTRIEVLTEGILTRQLQHDPALQGVGLVIFDEFHERSLQADLGLALTLDAQRNLVPELRVLVMSATLEGERVAALLGDDAAVIHTQLPGHPVETRFAARRDERALPMRAAGAVIDALHRDPGDVLVFLPGAGDIRRTQAHLQQADMPGDVEVLGLYGELSREAQDQALAPAPAGRRKVVLATNIAETSLTIEGVRIVIDSGLARVSRFDAASGMSRLVTTRISQASAEQRRGRAGRLAPGVCIRLWTLAEQRQMASHAPAEILEADLAPLALELACWGTASGDTLSWLDAPPAASLAQAQGLLQRLGALDAAARVTPHGRAMAALGTHPRLAHMLLTAQASGEAATACALAALLGERDPLRGDAARDADVRSRLVLLAARALPAGQARDLQAIRRTMALFARRLKMRLDATRINPDAAGALLASAYPDRIAGARSGSQGRYLLSNGRGAFLDGAQLLAREPWLVAAHLDAGEREAKIHLAAALTREALEETFQARIASTERVSWDTRSEAVVAVRETRFEVLVLDTRRLDPPPPEASVAAMLEGVRALGLQALPWTPALRQWQARIELLRRHLPDAEPPWPDVSDAALLETLDGWLGRWLAGCTRRAHLARLDLAAILGTLLDWSAQQRLERLAPTHVTVPSGSNIALDYTSGETPILAVRLQEVFGMTESPRVVDARVAVLMQLLSPARRPVQLTQDLASFWDNTYHQVRKELKGRYPKHYWPENPREATATRRVRPS
ncbi:MAG: ATP-dependent helicase HrpB [Gammaproteobacteria bacterium]|nr:ATP-dependent helicase HrpB [Gammaproteobacteria bacterium]